MNLHDYDLIQLGKREGREEGLSQGRHDTQIETARKLLSMNVLSVEQISQASSLTVEEVLDLQKKPL